MDFNTICRTCLTTETLNPIFKDVQDRSRYSTAVLITTGLKIEYNDGLPQNMCIHCMSFINNSLQFRKKCKEAEIELLKTINRTETTRHEEMVIEIPNQAKIRNEKELIKQENDLSDDEKPLKYFCVNKTQEITQKTTIKTEEIIKEIIDNNDSHVSTKPRTDSELQTLKDENMSNSDSELEKVYLLLDSDTKTTHSQEEIENVLKTYIPTVKHRKPYYTKNVNNCLDFSNDDLNNHNYSEYTTEKKPNSSEIISNTSEILPNATEILPNDTEIPLNDLNNCINISNDISSSYTSALIIHNNNNRVTCILCQKNLSVRSVDAHMSKRHPGVDERKVKCELCDVYVTRQKLNRHRVLIHGLECFRCGYCKTEFDSKEVLVDHVKSCTAKKKRRKINKASKELSECDICHKMMQKGSLRLHKEIKHAGMGPVCEHCGRKFSNKFRLNEHLRAKHGHDKFKCTACDFQTASAMALTNHERRHRGEKPFVCETCGAKFHAPYLLTQHKQSHRAEKLIKCELCPATFKANNSLHMHKMSCHSDVSYKCSMCARHYSCRHYAVKHMRNVHRYTGPVGNLEHVEKKCVEISEG